MVGEISSASGHKLDLSEWLGLVNGRFLGYRAQKKGRSVPFVLAFCLRF